MDTDDEDALEDDEDFGRKKKSKQGADDVEVDGSARIEFRGNQAEAIEDEELATKRSESLAKSQEEEKLMLNDASWNIPPKPTESEGTSLLT